jgi:hypothetical protein
MVTSRAELGKVATRRRGEEGALNVAEILEREH